MHDEHTSKQKVFGIIAEYDDPNALLKAAKQAYQAGYRNMDAYSPFPVHGLAEAVGMHKTRLSWFTLGAGLTGAALAFGMQCFASIYHYPYEIGGRPYFSWPAFIPITFEGTILLGAFTTGFAMILLNGLPRPYHPLFNAKHFERVTSDGFFLCIESTDQKYDPENTRRFLEGLEPKAVDVSEVMD